MKYLLLLSTILVSGCANNSFRKPAEAVNGGNTVENQNVYPSPSNYNCSDFENYIHDIDQVCESIVDRSDCKKELTDALFIIGTDLWYLDMEIRAGRLWNNVTSQVRERNQIFFSKLLKSNFLLNQEPPPTMKQLEILRLSIRCRLEQ